MHWPSPWSVGFPGWHLECSVMSTKYLGKQFDIHGGGTDLKFPHHENEVAQNFGAYSCTPARYWMHANMLLMNGAKMAKSEGNFITPHQIFTGESEHISKSYSPEVVRFFMLQAHYRSTLDLTDDALGAAEKGLQRLMETFENLQALKAPEKPINDALINELKESINALEDEMDDDFNVPKALARMFEIAPKINGLKNGQIDINLVDATTITEMQTQFGKYIHDVFGLRKIVGVNQNEKLDNVMQLVLELRQKARENKDWPTADKIRDGLATANITVKDGKDGTTWS
jgi:cysteinyl-tRNA synthetase